MTDAHTPRRPGRPPRAEAVAAVRTRRRDATLDRDSSLNLSLPPEYQADKEHDYRWVNDVKDRTDRLYRQDWDFVLSSKPEASDEERLRRRVGEITPGQPKYAYLMRKPKDLVEADEATKMAAIEAKQELMLQGQPAEAVPGAYSPGTNSITQSHQPSVPGGYQP